MVYSGLTDRNIGNLSGKDLIRIQLPRRLNNYQFEAAPAQDNNVGDLHNACFARLEGSDC